MQFRWKEVGQMERRMSINGKQKIDRMEKHKQLKGKHFTLFYCDPKRPKS